MTTPVTHKCGHRGTADVSKKKPYEAEEFINWVQGKPCRDCDPAKKARDAKFLADRKKARDAEAIAAETAFGFSPLRGTPAMISWGRSSRVHLVAQAWDLLGLSESEFAEQVADKANEVNSAGWWIDNREAQATDLPALLTKALGDDTQTTRTGSENPF